MKFFVPLAEDELAANMYDALTKGLPQPSTERRIFKIEYQHDGNNYVAQVGEWEKQKGGLIMAIFEHTTGFTICYLRGKLYYGEKRMFPEPMMIDVPSSEVINITDFES